MHHQKSSSDSPFQANTATPDKKNNVLYFVEAGGLKAHLALSQYRYREAKARCSYTSTSASSAPIHVTEANYALYI